MPSVVMNEGTRSLVVTRPLTSPATPPAASRTRVATSQCSAGKEA